jgi:hypothetical protein
MTDTWGLTYPAKNSPFREITSYMPKPEPGNTRPNREFPGSRARERFFLFRSSYSYSYSYYLTTSQASAFGAAATIIHDLPRHKQSPLRFHKERKAAVQGRMRGSSSTAWRVFPPPCLGYCLEQTFPFPSLSFPFLSFHSLPFPSRRNLTYVVLISRHACKVSWIMRLG